MRAALVVFVKVYARRPDRKKPRGKDVTTRGSRVARVQGGSVRIN